MFTPLHCTTNQSKNIIMNFLKRIYFLLATVALLAACSDDDDDQTIMVDAGAISGGPFTFIVDGTADFVSGITTDGNGVGTNSSFVITDDQNNILGLPGTIEDLEGVNFDGAGVGTCFIWYIRYEGELTGLAAGENANDLQGNFDLSNSIQVDRVIGAAGLVGGPFDFIVDGVADNIPEGGITIENAGTDLGNTGWVVTDTEGTILGLPPMFTAPDFDAAGSGTCLVWYISYETGLSGLEVGLDADDLDGVFALSNPITVNRLDAPVLNGGPFTFIVDGTADNLAEGDITVEGGFSVNDQSSWVVTNEEGTILGLPPSFTGPDFDAAGEGTCFVWYITYGSDFSGLDVDNNVADLSGVYELSNGITVNRLVAPEISGGPFDFIVEGTADNLSEGDITVDVAGTMLDESGWVITDDQGNILGLPPTFTAPDFDAAGSGTCLVWYINYETGLAGLEVGMNAGDLSGVFALSNSVAVNRLDAPVLSGGPFNFTVGDGTADNIPEGGITVTGGYALEGQSSWIVTDDQGAILGLPPSFTAPDFDGAGAGNCYIYYVTFGEGLTGLTGPDADGNPTSSLEELEGVFELSNFIEVVRTEE